MYLACQGPLFSLPHRSCRPALSSLCTGDDASILSPRPGTACEQLSNSFQTASHLVSGSRSPQWQMPRQPEHPPQAVLGPPLRSCRLPLSCLQLRPDPAGMVTPGVLAVEPPEKLPGKPAVKLLRQPLCQPPPCLACSWAAAAEGPAGLCPGHGELAAAEGLAGLCPGHGEVWGQVEAPPNPPPLHAMRDVGQCCWGDLDQELLS